MVPLSFAGETFEALRCGALFWSRHRLLIVADLHLEKASFFARFGQMLPPYDSLATLDELADAIARTGAEGVLCLGDNFHDSGGEARLGDDAERLLGDLCGRVDWTWLTGNHDPDVTGRCGGRVLTETAIDGLRFVHASSRRDGPELSGHFHPRLMLSLRGRRVARRCYVRSHDRLILPSFGALTGGMDAAHHEIARAMGHAPAEALVALDDRLLCFPLSTAPVRASA